MRIESPSKPISFSTKQIKCPRQTFSNACSSKPFLEYTEYEVAGLFIEQLLQLAMFLLFMTWPIGHGISFICNR